MRIDIGCGTAKKEGWIGVDSVAFPGVDVVADLTKPWPWQDETVDEARCHHMLEHLTQQERMFFANELCRVLKKGGKAEIQTPDPWNDRALADPTHKWPAVVPMSYSYWNKAWRDKEAPHVDAANMPGGLTCDFDYGAGYGIPTKFMGRNMEFINFAVAHYLDGRGDLTVTMTKR